MPSLRYLLLQIRKPTDPMRDQEVDCFARALKCDRADLTQVDLIDSAPTSNQLTEFDAAFVGGSGDYSVVRGGSWLAESLASLRMIADSGLPMFASCWGFQALAAAFGGEVVSRSALGELGSTPVWLTDEGVGDPVFAVAYADESPVSNTSDVAQNRRFLAHSGHEDTVVRMPSEAICLASSERVSNQALKLIDRPVYATQFHPELRREDYLQRLRAYPRYVAELTGLPFDQFADGCSETPEANRLLEQFVREVVA